MIDPRTPGVFAADTHTCLPPAVNADWVLAGIGLWSNPQGAERHADLSGWQVAKDPRRQGCRIGGSGADVGRLPRDACCTGWTTTS